MSYSLSYGPSSLITEVKNTLIGDKEYAHDPLNQLVQEGEKEYFFDSLGNPENCQTNSLNQILSSPSHRFIYDDNGNLLQKISADVTILYEYDALNRLISVTYPGERKVSFFYDPLSRLSYKEVEGKKLFYLYDQDKEIGTIDARGNIEKLKVLGLGLQGDIGAAVALELEGNIFAPLHDSFGNIIALLSSDGQIVETYKMDAFGREETPSQLNPWRFSSKREEEGLIFFGKRFYDPSLGRWLTPDPAGYVDGSNLYLYVCNSPLNRLDLFGLASYPIEFRIETMPSSSTYPIYANRPNIQNMLHCKVSCNGAETDCFIFSKTWHQFQFTQEELNVGKIDCNRFFESFPKSGQIIAASLFMNGIDTTKQGFFKMCAAFYDKIPENHLFIGLHNPTAGFVGDVFRVVQELKGIEETPIVCFARQFLAAFVEGLDKVNPELLVSLTAHSEGGLIKRNAIEGMTPEQKDLVKKHVLYFGVAPAKPMPLSHVFDASNVYSEKDTITRPLGKSFMGNSNYDIRMLPCLTEKKDRPLFGGGDHAFLAPTQQKALGEQVRIQQGKYGYYDFKTR